MNAVDFVLTIVTLLAVACLLAITLMITRRQLADLRDSKRLLAALAAYAISNETDLRNVRNALRDLATTLGIQRAVASLDVPPDTEISFSSRETELLETWMDK